MNEIITEADLHPSDPILDVPSKPTPLSKAVRFQAVRDHYQGRTALSGVARRDLGLDDELPVTEPMRRVGSNSFARLMDALSNEPGTPVGPPSEDDPEWPQDPTTDGFVLVHGMLVEVPEPRDVVSMAYGVVGRTRDHR